MDEVMRILEIPIKEILEDFFYRFQTQNDVSRLRDSIKTSGIILPLRVEQQGKGYRILSGFNRYRCACDLGLDCVPAILIKKHEEPGRVFQQILREHLVCRSLNLMEKSRILNMLDKLDRHFSKENYLKLSIQLKILEPAYHVSFLKNQLKNIYKLHSYSAK